MTYLNKEENIDLNNPCIDYDEIKKLGEYIDNDGKILFKDSLNKIALNTWLIYEKDKSINLATLINSYSIINFPVLISTMSLNVSIVKIFKMINFFPIYLSRSLKIDRDKEIIELYKDDSRLSWFEIIKNSLPISSENLQKYYPYLRNIDILFTSEEQNFTRDDIVFIIKYEIEKIQEKNNFIECINIIENIFRYHNTFSEEDLLYILKQIKKIKVDKPSNSINDKQWLIETTAITEIICNCKYTEKLWLENKGLMRTKEIKNLICSHGVLSEAFIEENPKFIDWENLSKNTYLLTGCYSIDFYKKYSNNIIWKNFDSITLFKFYFSASKEVFRNFILELNQNITTNSLFQFLSYHKFNDLNDYPFTTEEMIKYFKDALEYKKVDFYYYNVISEEFAIALAKIDGNFNFIKFLNEGMYGKKFISTFKKEIFEIMLEDGRNGLETKTKKRINVLLDELKKERTE